MLIQMHFIWKSFKYLHLLKFEIIFPPKFCRIKKTAAPCVFCVRRYSPNNYLSFDAHALYFVRPLYLVDAQNPIFFFVRQRYQQAPGSAASSSSVPPTRIGSGGGILPPATAAPPAARGAAPPARGAPPPYPGVPQGGPGHGYGEGRGHYNRSRGGGEVRGGGAAAAGQDRRSWAPQQQSSANRWLLTVATLGSFQFHKHLSVLFIEYRKGWISPVQGFCLLHNPLRCVDAVHH